MSTRDYYANVVADSGMTLQQERHMLLAYIASIGAERGLCEYARGYIAERPPMALRPQYSDLRPEVRHPAGGEWAYPDTFPPNFQER